MNNLAATIKPISHEWHLGNQLNESVLQGNSDSFRLLLAMLSADVQDQVQFDKLKQDLPSKADLRKVFELPAPQKFYADNDSVVASENKKLIKNSNIADIRLLNCLNPEPLCGCEIKGVGYEVLSVLSPLEQFKQRALTADNFDHEPEFNWNLADTALVNMLNKQKLSA